MVVGLLGHLRHAVDERHRRREVVELEVAPSSAVRRAATTRSIGASGHTCRVRIVSLVPSATEMLFALGVGDEVTAVTHECDHPPEALELPKVTRDVIGPGLPPDEIDRAVRELTEQGRAIYELDEHALRSARARPDRHPGAVRRLRRLLRRRRARSPSGWTRRRRSISLDPHTLGEVLGDVRTLAQATGRQGRGRRPRRATPRRGSTASGSRCATRRRSRVAALEWLDPVYVAGHWTPQLIEYAGGDRRARPAGERSETRTWEEVAAAGPTWSSACRAATTPSARSRRPRPTPTSSPSCGARRVVAVDAAAYFSRPGPRLVDGLELLAHILHPDRVPEAPGGGAASVVPLGAEAHVRPVRVGVRDAEDLVVLRVLVAHPEQRDGLTSIGSRDVGSETAIIASSGSPSAASVSRKTVVVGYRAMRQQPVELDRPELGIPLVLFDEPLGSRRPRRGRRHARTLARERVAAGRRRRSRRPPRPRRPARRRRSARDPGAAPPSRSITNAATAPPTSPPMCPPIEMLGMMKPSARLSRISGPMPGLHRVDPARALHHERRAHQPEHRAGGADRHGVGREAAARRTSRPAATRSRARGSARGRAPARASCPSQYRMYMLKPMCSRPECRKPAVTSRQ